MSAGLCAGRADPRDTNSSEGDATAWSPQEGDDIHDTVDWIAQQSRCTGKVGVADVSHLAVVQWFAGATRPTHFATLIP